MSDLVKTAPQHAPMQQFVVRDGELCIGGEKLSLLAERVGQTPFYAYERDALKRRVAELRAALPQAVKLHYAMKANPLPALVGFMAGLVDGIDVASAGELKVALDAGADAAEIIWHRGTTATGRDRIARMAQRWLVATVGEHGRNADEWWLRWGMITAIARAKA